MADKHFPNGLPRGKMKTLFGLYKICGRDLFLELAKHYCDNVQTSVEPTIAIMESTWFDEANDITVAEKMVHDYNEQEGAFDPKKKISVEQEKRTTNILLG